MMDKEGLGKIIRDKMQYLKPEGVKVVMHSADDPDMRGSPMVMEWQADNTDTHILRVDPAMVMALYDTAKGSGKKGPKQAKQFFDALIREEELHAADDISAKQEYDTLGPTAKHEYEKRGLRRQEPGFQVFQREKRYKQIIIEGRNMRDSAPQADRKAIEDAFKASWNLYAVHAHQHLDESNKSYTGKDIFKVLLNYDDTLNMGNINFMAEFLRQLKQERLDARLTEETYSSIYSKIQQWFRNAVNLIKKASVTAHKGGLGPEMRSALFDIERVINNSEDLLRQAKFTSIQTTKQGTQSYKEWAGNSITIDRKTGINKTLYHATKGDFDEFKYIKDIGHHFGTLKQATDRMNGIAGFGGGEEDWRGWNIMPVTIRMENPIRLPDLGGWDAQSFTNALEEAGP